MVRRYRKYAHRSTFRNNSGYQRPTLPVFLLRCCNKLRSSGSWPPQMRIWPLRVLISAHRTSLRALLSELRYHPLSCLTPLHREHRQHRILLAHRLLHNIKATASLHRTCPRRLPQDKTKFQGCTSRRCWGHNLRRSK